MKITFDNFHLSSSENLPKKSAENHLRINLVNCVRITKSNIYVILIKKISLVKECLTSFLTQDLLSYLRVESLILPIALTWTAILSLKTCLCAQLMTEFFDIIYFIFTFPK